MLLLLPIKEYAEGPVEIRGGSAICTRKVLWLYVESPIRCTRKVFGFCTVSQVFVGNFAPLSCVGVRGRSRWSLAALSTPKRGRFEAYAESPNRCIAPSTMYAEGPWRLLVDSRTRPGLACTRKVRIRGASEDRPYSICTQKVHVFGSAHCT
jgi:hypothetical protein